jgi:hypothetical protein
MNARPLACALALSFAGCQETTSLTADASAPDGGLANNGAWTSIPGATCNAQERNVATQESPHVDPDAGAIAWLTNPPSSGPHYPIWARWGAWPAIPRGHWIHNLEHGGVAYLYRCPMGACEAVRDGIVAAVNALPTDRACTPDDASPARVRAVITSDNEITTPIAAAAWGWLYRADCVDAASLRSFYTRHAGMAPEDFCADGSYP